MWATGRLFSQVSAAKSAARNLGHPNARPPAKIPNAKIPSPQRRDIDAVFSSVRLAGDLLVMMVAARVVVMAVVSGESRHRCAQQQDTGQYGDP